MRFNAVIFDNRASRSFALRCVNDKEVRNISRDVGQRIQLLDQVSNRELWLDFEPRLILSIERRLRDKLKDFPFLRRSRVVLVHERCKVWLRSLFIKGAESSADFAGKGR